MIEREAFDGSGCDPARSERQLQHSFTPVRAPANGTRALTGRPAPFARSIRAWLSDLLGRYYARVRTALYLIFAVLLVAVTAQRSFFPLHPHYTFPIFRASFWHLIHQRDLYAQYFEKNLFKF